MNATRVANGSEAISGGKKNSRAKRVCCLMVAER
jgi:hypothetical protein